MVQHAVEAIIRKEWSAVPVGPLKDIKAQLNNDERQLLFYLTRDYYRGDGALIDGGAFLGGSASCMALGLRENRVVPEERKHGAIQSYDLFVSGTWIADKWFPQGRPPDGADIRPLYEANLGALLRYVTVHHGDITRERWQGGPVEILFLDICKTVPTNDHCTRMFFRELIPGRSIVIQQDYLFRSWNIWIYVTMELLREHFEMVSACRVNSVAYLCTKPITEADVARALVGPLSHQRRVELALAAAARWTGDARSRLEDSVKEYLERCQETVTAG